MHELAHQWLYLIEDIWPLGAPGAARLTLPSGTRDRTLPKVLGAAHVAATLIRLYGTAGGPHAATRISGLARYGQGCLEIAQGAAADLTDAGHQISQRLKEAL